MTELKARVSGLKTFCTARYLRKSASRGFGWLSILKDVYSKQCRLLAQSCRSGMSQHWSLLGARRTSHSANAIRDYALPYLVCGTVLLILSRVA